jgi:hypothetical protein
VADYMFDERLDAHERPGAGDRRRARGRPRGRMRRPRRVKPEEVRIEVEDDILTLSGGSEERKEALIAIKPPLA